MISPILKDQVERGEVGDGLEGRKKWRWRFRDRKFEVERLGGGLGNKEQEVQKTKEEDQQELELEEDEDEEDDPWNESEDPNSSFTRSALSLGSHSSKSSISSSDSFIQDRGGSGVREEPTIRQRIDERQLEEGWESSNQFELLLELLRFLSDNLGTRLKAITIQDQIHSPISVFRHSFLPSFQGFLLSHLNSLLPFKMSKPPSGTFQSLEDLRILVNGFQIELLGIEILGLKEGEEEKDQGINLEDLENWLKKENLEKKLIEKINEG